MDDPSGRSNGKRLRSKVAEPTDLNVGTALALMERRIFRTARARIATAKRLDTRAATWNTFLISFSLSTLIAAIATIQWSGLYGPGTSVLLAILAAIALAGSLVVAGREYGARSRQVSHNYLALHALATRIEAAKLDRTQDQHRLLRESSAHYLELLGAAENHSSGDYFSEFPPVLKSLSNDKSRVHECETKAELHSCRRALFAQRTLTYVPLLATAVPIAVCIPVGLVML